MTTFSDQNSQSKQARIEALFRQFEQLRHRRRTEGLTRMADFLTEFEAKMVELNRQRPASFNLFNLFGVTSNEVWHTQFLAWLLDARADHGQGDLFFRAFVSICELSLAVDPHQRYQVRPEYQLSESIPDILIYAPRQFLILIENKIYAAEGVDQLAREFRDLQRMADGLDIPAASRFGVFLTPYGQQPVTDDPAHWFSLSYQQLAAAIDIDQISDDRVRYLLADWQQTVTRFGG